MRLATTDRRRGLIFPSAKGKGVGVVGEVSLFLSLPLPWHERARVSICARRAGDAAAANPARWCSIPCSLPTTEQTSIPGFVFWRHCSSRMCRTFVINKYILSRFRFINPSRASSKLPRFFNSIPFSLGTYISSSFYERR